ncbi:MAG: RIP metalloprotease RseP [Rhodospirillaceae bacterium TMED8]|nr:RIP metalloprotease RseP [Magnetovibrio sp.]OUT51665.1 MAG: RIP metalloprotease RseP [Rhodospirillaceae bacterium TMED8]
MGFFDFTWYFIVVFLFVLTVLVYVHEWGHYWVAKRNGVRIEVFSIGFGPELFGWTNAVGTRWKISAIPLGGYVKMFGENMDDDETGQPVSLTPEEKAVSFNHKTLRQRAAIVFAGPAVNFIFAIFIFAGLAMFQGLPISLAVIGEVLPNSAASQAGMMKNDKIIAVDNKEIINFSELRSTILRAPGQKLNFQIERGDKILMLSATPRLAEGRNDEGIITKIGLLGIRPDMEQLIFERQNPAMAVWVGIDRTYTLTKNILVYVGDMITGNRTAEDLGGPIRIAQISGEMAQKGFVYVILLMAMLSVNLGLINLFPIPMLDGGHLAFYAVEAIRGKPLDPKIQEYGLRFGLVLVLSLVVFVTWNDLVHIRVIEFIKNLFV